LDLFPGENKVRPYLCAFTEKKENPAMDLGQNVFFYRNLDIVRCALNGNDGMLEYWNDEMASL
jgi:hypothetical protein